MGLCLVRCYGCFVSFVSFFSFVCLFCLFVFFSKILDTWMWKLLGQGKRATMVGKKFAKTLKTEREEWRIEKVENDSYRNTVN